MSDDDHGMTPQQVADLEEGMARVARVTSALHPFIEPHAGPKWERFTLTFWARRHEDAIRYDGWDLQKFGNVIPIDGTTEMDPRFETSTSGWSVAGPGFTTRADPLAHRYRATVHVPGRPLEIVAGASLAELGERVRALRDTQLGHKLGHESEPDSEPTVG